MRIPIGYHHADSVACQLFGDWAHGGSGVGLRTVPQQRGGLTGRAQDVDQSAGRVLDGFHTTSLPDDARWKPGMVADLLTSERTIQR
jgi:hypothetical protein